MKTIAACLSLLWLISLPVLITPSEAGILTNTRGAPGPVFGGGLASLVIAGGAYWFVTRLRRKGG